MHPWGLMADAAIMERIRDLSDLELAALICLVAEEHCIIDTEPEALDELAEELELVCSIPSGNSTLILIDLLRLRPEFLVFLML